MSMSMVDDGDNLDTDVIDGEESPTGYWRETQGVGSIL